MVRPKKNPFRPGAGRFPPERVGHTEAATYLADRLEDIRDNGEGDMVVLFGPRGNGKTVLLSELERMAGAGRVRHEMLRTRMMTGDQDVLAERLAPRRGLSLMGIIARWIKKLFIGGDGLSAGVEFRGPTKIPTWDALHATLQEGPVLLIVDEAHEMPADFGQDFLQAMQDFVRAGLPLLVVLAGTPGLRAHLGKMHASFWERCQKLRIGRLEVAEAVREALAKPAKASGMPIDEDALERLVEESQRYPFFVQKLGFEAWNAARARGGSWRITLEDAHRGVAATKRDLWDFYTDRRREVDQQSVLSEAEAVSRVVVGRGPDPRFSATELVDAVKSAAVPNGRDPGRSLERLTHLGLIWEVPETNCWEPGIPSLCRFLVEQVGEPVLSAPES